MWDDGFDVEHAKSFPKLGVWISPKAENLLLEQAKLQFINFSKSVEELLERKTIPRIIHHIWFGEEVNITDEAHFCMNSWKRYHPDFEFRFWTEESIFNMFDTWKIPRSLLISCPNHGERSDIARYYILRFIGGFYVDTDVECLGEMNPIFLQASFIASFANVTPKCEIGNALIGCQPNCDIMLQLCQEVSSKEAIRKRMTDDTCMGTISRTGPGLLTRVLSSQILYLEDGILLPPKFVYSIPNDKSTIDNQQEIRDKLRNNNSFAVHWWHKSWQSSIEQE